MKQESNRGAEHRTWKNVTETDELFSNYMAVNVQLVHMFSNGLGVFKITQKIFTMIHAWVSLIRQKRIRLSKKSLISFFGYVLMYSLNV